MGRFVGLSINKGKGGGGGSVKTESFTRSTGISTDSNNNVTEVTLGDTKYTQVKYNNVGLVTGFNEDINGTKKGWILNYDSEGLVTSIDERSAPHFDPSYSVSTTSTAVNEGSSITFDVTTTELADGTTVYYDTNLDDADFSGSTENGSFTITSNAATFTVTLANDTFTEGAETLTARLYDDAGRTNQVATSNSVTINDTSLGVPMGDALFHADSVNSTASYSWAVPTGVTSISVICVGGGGGGETNHDGASGCGGGLAYKNNITVTPGATVSVYVGGGGYGTNGQTDTPDGKSSYITYAGTNYAVANGGTGADGNQSNGWLTNSNSFPNTNSDGGGDGGSGIHYSGCRMSGGGAGGYNGGGDQSSGFAGNNPYWGVSPGGGSNGGGGGGTSANGSSPYYSAGGGGTGVYGQGTSGAAGDFQGSPSNETSFTGKGGSTAYNTGLRGYSVESSNNTYAAGSNLGNGYDRSSPTNGQSGTRPDGGFPGGGGGGGNSGHSAGWGGHGIVRIIWGTVNGNARAFPSTNVNRVDNYDGTKSETVYGSQKMY